MEKPLNNFSDEARSDKKKVKRIKRKRKLRVGVFKLEYKKAIFECVTEDDREELFKELSEDAELNKYPKPVML